MKKTIRAILLIFKVFILFFGMVYTASASHHKEKSIGRSVSIQQFEKAAYPVQQLEERISPVAASRIAHKNSEKGLTDYLSGYKRIPFPSSTKPVTKKLNSFFNSIPLFVLNRIFII